MKIAIVGPGAMGSLFGAFLARSGEDVWILDHRGDRATHIEKSGIKVEGISGNFRASVKATTDPKKISTAELVILCVKSYDTETAAKKIKSLLSEETLILTLQNGLGNIQIIEDAVDSEKIIAGVTSHGATLLGWGHVKHAGKGETIIGRLDGALTGRLRTIASIFKKAGFDTRSSKDIKGLIWSKLIINVGINGLTAVTRLNNGRLVEYEGVREVMRAAVSEAVKIARRKRIKLAYDDPIQKVESVCRATSGNISSMLQDVLHKRKTEIDFINGAIVRQAKGLGIATPTNETLMELVKTVEESYDKYITT